MVYVNTAMVKNTTARGCKIFIRVMEFWKRRTSRTLAYSSMAFVLERGTFITKKQTSSMMERLSMAYTTESEFCISQTVTFSRVHLLMENVKVEECIRLQKKRYFMLRMITTLFQVMQSPYHVMVQRRTYGYTTTELYCKRHPSQLLTQGKKISNWITEHTSSTNTGGVPGATVKDTFKNDDIKVGIACSPLGKPTPPRLPAGADVTNVRVALQECKTNIETLEKEMKELSLIMDTPGVSEAKKSQMKRKFTLLRASKAREEKRLEELECREIVR
eukprot:PhF_6_TR7057/c0_g1_i1/m.10643